MYSALPIWCDSSLSRDAFNRVGGDGTLPHKCVMTGFNNKRAVTMLRAAQKSDLLVTSGGVSVGEHLLYKCF